MLQHVRTCFGFLFADRLEVQTRHGQRLDDHQTRIITLEDADKIRRKSLEDERVSREQLTLSTRGLAEQLDTFGARVEKMSDDLGERIGSLGDHVLSLTQSVGVLQGRAEIAPVPERRTNTRRHEGRRGQDHKSSADAESTPAPAEKRKRTARKPKDA